MKITNKRAELVYFDELKVGEIFRNPDGDICLKVKSFSRYDMDTVNLTKSELDCYGYWRVDKQKKFERVKAELIIE